MEGVLTGKKGAYDCPVLLKIYGPADPAVRANCMLYPQAFMYYKSF